MHEVALAARRWGVELGYHDIFGRWHEAPASTLRAITGALSQGRERPSAFVAPQRNLRSFQSDGARVWGLAVQLYAVRSIRNWGIGDFADLRQIVELAAAAGASAVGVNPFHALFLDRPEMASPYAPNSRVFLNPLYIAVDKIEEFDPGLAPVQEIRRARQLDFVDYGFVANIKLAVLRQVYDRFSQQGTAARKVAFEEFRRERGEALKRFAAFEVLRRKFSGPWWQWPEPWRNPDNAAVDRLYESHAHEFVFAAFLQWVAHEQLAACRDTARANNLGIGLYLDIAVGVDPCGADAWAGRHTILANLELGAPPDEYNPAGQQWGLAPFNPHTLADNEFASMRALLSETMRYAGAVRLDHALGLMRQFLVPRGRTAAEGTYVRFPFEQLLQVIAEESNRYRCIFIGEDLGTVPDGFREIAAQWGLWSYRVMIFERFGDVRFRPPGDYPAESLATFNTHDLPTFRGWMTGQDLASKRAIGFDPGETEEARNRSRKGMREMLATYCGHNGPEHFAAVAGFLAATGSRLVMVQIDDLLDVAEQINIPGTVHEYPNWRRKLPIAIENWATQPIFRSTVEAFDYSGRSRRR